MAIDFTISRLIDDVQRHASVPRNQDVYSEAEFAALFNDCMQMRIAPAVMRVREEHFVSERLLELADLTELPDQRLSLLLPPRVIGSRLRLVELLDRTGGLVNNIPKLPADNFQYYGYIFKGNRIIFSADILQQGSQIRLQFFRRPSDLVPRAEVAKVTTVNGLTGAVTVDNVPDGWAVGSTLDLQAAAEPFETLLEETPIVSIVGPIITISPAAATLLVAGDYLCLAGTTIIPQIPVVLFPILVQYAVAKVLESLGKLDAAALVMRELPTLEQNLYDLLDDRDEASPQKVNSRNPLWGGSSRWPRRNW